MSEKRNLWKMAQGQIDDAAKVLKLEPAVHSILREPLREFHFRIPVNMDDGTVKIFDGFRVQHNDARGPAKGGIRFHPHETIEDVKALAAWMAWKCAVADIPLGGGKGGVICDPREMSERELECLCRGWVRAIYKNIGPWQDVPAPDMMTNPQMMGWMMDEYSVLTGKYQPSVITGKPVSIGGSLGRTSATGDGVVFTIREALKNFGLDPKSVKASVQGFGNVAQYTALNLVNLGVKVLCVSDVEGSVCNPDGIDPNYLMSITNKFGVIDRSKLKDGYEALDGEAWLEQEVDILAPCALENQIREDNVNKIKDTVKIIASGANGPVTPEADKVIQEREIFLIPDFLCNAGGVTVSYFEQVQGNYNYFWSEEEVRAKLDQKITKAFWAVVHKSRELGIYTRDAAYCVAIERVSEAMKRRGWI